MEVITFESEAYKALVGKIEKIAGYVAEAQLPSEEKKEAWLDSNQLAEALGISTRTLQRLRDENLISYSMLRGRCMYKLSEVERCAGRAYHSVQASNIGGFSQELPNENRQ